MIAAVPANDDYDWAFGVGYGGNRLMYMGFA